MRQIQKPVPINIGVRQQPMCVDGFVHFFPLCLSAKTNGKMLASIAVSVTADAGPITAAAQTALHQRNNHAAHTPPESAIAAVPCITSFCCAGNAPAAADSLFRGKLPEEVYAAAGEFGSCGNARSCSFKSFLFPVRGDAGCSFSGK